MNILPLTVTLYHFSEGMFHSENRFDRFFFSHIHRKRQISVKKFYFSIIRNLGKYLRTFNEIPYKIKG